MTDKVSSFKIGVEGDAGDIPAFLQSLKTQFQSAVRDIQSLTSKLNLFSSVQEDSQKAATALAAAKDAVAALQAQIAKVQSGGGAIGDDLAASLKKAEQAAASAQKQFDSQQKQLDKLRTTLTAAGVDTTNLGAAQAKLAAQLTATTNAAAQQAAKDLLGFKSLDDVQPKINALNAAFQTLKTSGTLSATEIQAAEAKLAEQIALVKAEVTDLGVGFKSTAVGASESFRSVAGAVTSAIAGFAAFDIVTSKIKAAIDAAREFNGAVTQIGTITDLSTAQLNQLGEGARALARSIGTDVVEATKQLYAIIRSGISPDNSLTVLAASADAAKISQTSLGDATKVATTLVNQFGVQTDDVARVLDIFIQGAKKGGPTLTELSSSLAALAPIAQATNTPIEDIAASLQVMAKAGVPAEAAVGDLSKILTKLNTDAARKQLADLGITTTGLVATLQQIGAKNIDLNGLLQLGLTSQKSASALAALTSGSKGLAVALDAQKTATTEAAKALELIDATPAERLELLKAASKDTEISFGNMVGITAKFAAQIAALQNGYNNLSQGTRTLIADTGDFRLLIGAMIAGFTTGAKATTDFGAAATKTAVALQNSVSSIQGAVAQQIATVAAQISQARSDLQGYADDLAKLVTASQAATQASIADLNARAAAQIASLDQSTAAEAATAAATLAIQQKLIADRLALISTSATQVLAALDAEAQAQLAAARKNGLTEVQIQQGIGQQILQARLAALGQIKSQYEAHYSDLLAQEKSFVDKINGIDATQVSFNQDIQTRLSAIRNEGLSDFDAYISKVGQINTLLAQAQQAFQQGGQAGLALGKTYTDQAIALSGTLKTVVNADGVAVVSAFDLQQKKIELISKAADQYNTALGDQKQLAIDGAAATTGALQQVGPKLTDIRTQYDDLNKKVGEGLKVKITSDEKDISDLTQKINDAVTKQEFLAKVKIDADGLKGQVDTLVTQIKAGVVEGVDTQLDAIKTKIGDIAKEAPELKVDSMKALQQVEDVRQAVLKLADARPKLTVDSNVADVQKDIDKLKLPTESTHTVHIVTDGTLPGGGTPGGTQDTTPAPSSPDGFARGGPVGFIARHFPRVAERFAIAQQFAKGGSVFPRPNWLKVPGTGSGDTVPAALESGSFVVKKAASAKYGDAIMSHLATTARRINFLAGGGFGMNDRGLGVTDPKKLSDMEQFIADVAKATHDSGTGPTAPVIDPSKGYQPGDSFQSKQPPVSFDVRQVPESLFTAINAIGYAREMLNGVAGGPLNPLLGVLSQEIPILINRVQANPSDTASIDQLVQVAETIGANPQIFSMWGKTARSANPPPPEWFYDYLQKTQAGSFEAAIRAQGGGGGGGGLSGGIPVPNGGIAQRVLTGGNNDFAKRFFASPAFGMAFYKENPLATIRKDTPLATIASELFAAGGAAAGTDTVPAMLTPGEFVINRESASMLGAPLLHAVNDMRITRGDLANFISGRYPGPAPSGPIHRFAEGGAVGKIPETGAMQGNGPGQVIHEGDTIVNMNVSVADIFSEPNIRRYFLPVINGIIRRSPDKK